MTNEKTKYMDELAKFVIGEEMKLKRTKGEKDKTKPLGVGHLSDEAKGTSVKEGKREYASGTISKSVKRDLEQLDSLMNKYSKKFGEDFMKKYNKLMDRMKAGSPTFNLDEHKRISYEAKDKDEQRQRDAATFPTDEHGNTTE